MSFNSFGSSGRGHGYRGLEEEPHSYWKDLLLATLPAFVASVLPPVVMHFLEKKNQKHEEKKPTEQKPTTPTT